MAIATRLNSEITTWGALGIGIVVLSIVLLKFKTIGCTGATPIWNATRNACCRNSTCLTNSTAGLPSTIDSFVAAFSEPKNWVIIVIVGIIGFALFKLFRGGNKQ